MNNSKAIEKVLKSREDIIKKMSKKTERYVVEDAFQTVVERMLNSKTEIQENSVISYVLVGIDREIAGEYRKYFSRVHQWGGKDTASHLNLDPVISKMTSNTNYVERMVDEQDLRYRIKEMKKNVNSLKGKQKEAIEEYLSGINSNTPNFRQGLKSLRKIMSGKTVRTKGKGGYVSKSNRLGRVGKLKDEDVLDIRKNLKNDKDMLSKSLFYAIKYKVPKKTIFNVVRGISYKNVKEKKEE